MNTPPGSPISSSSLPPTPGKSLDLVDFLDQPAAAASRPEAAENKQLSKRQQRRQKQKQKHRDHCENAILTGKVDAAHARRLERRSKQIQAQARRKFQKGLELAKEDAVEFHHSGDLETEKRLKSRENLEAADAKIKLALRFKEAAKEEAVGDHTFFLNQSTPDELIPLKYNLLMRNKKF